MILYTRMLTWAAGMAVAPNLILIHPRSRDDSGLLAHEQVHCDQMRRVGTLRFWWRYIKDADFRQASEVEAYRVSYHHAPHRLNIFSIQLATRYRLDLTIDAAQRLIARQA